MFRRGSRFYTRERKRGQDRWISLGADYESACRKFRLLRREGWRPENNLTVEECAQKWLEMSVPMGRAARGISLAAQRVRDYLNPFMGHLQVARVSREDLRAYRKWLEGRGRSTLTVRHILSDARCFFRWAEDAGWIDRAPVPRRLLPKV